MPYIRLWLVDWDTKYPQIVAIMGHYWLWFGQTNGRLKAGRLKSGLLPHNLTPLRVRQCREVI